MHMRIITTLRKVQTTGVDVNVLLFVVGDVVVSVISFGGNERERVEVSKGTVGSVGVGVVGGSSVV